MNDDEVLAHLFRGCRAAGAKTADEATKILIDQGLGYETFVDGKRYFHLTDRARTFIEEAHAPEVGFG